MPVGSGNSAAKRKPAEYEVFTAGVISVLFAIDLIHFTDDGKYVPG